MTSVHDGGMLRMEDDGALFCVGLERAAPGGVGVKEDVGDCSSLTLAMNLTNLSSSGENFQP